MIVGSRERFAIEAEPRASDADWIWGGFRFRLREVVFGPFGSATTPAAMTLGWVTRKIAVHTSTMRQGTTLTTDVKIRLAPDASVDNEVFRVDDEGRTPAARLAVVTWTFEGSAVRSAHMMAAECALGTISDRFPECSTYLLAAHSTLQPDTLMVRRRLWKALSARGIPAGGDDLGEAVLPYEGGVRCFGLRRLKEGELAPSLAILEQEAASMLVAIRSEHVDVLKQVVAGGWPVPHRHPGVELLSTIVRAGGIVLWPLGRFDDREAGFIAFSEPNTARVLAGHSMM